MRLQKEVKPALLTAFLALALGGCGHEDPDLKISPIFNVCLGNSEGRYDLNQSKAVDWDDGKLSIGNRLVDVYIGEHPDINEKLLSRSPEKRQGFMLSGAPIEGGTTKVLYVETSGVRPLYIMFQSSDMSPDELLEHTKAYELKHCSK